MTNRHIRAVFDRKHDQQKEYDNKKMKDYIKKPIQVQKRKI
jgi:hypothetical protein